MPFGLIVEDELSLAQALQLALGNLKIESRHVTNLKSARRVSEKWTPQSAPDFILLDRNLPDGDGIDFCAELRKRGYQGGILMLTVHAETEERVRGLDAGADDYLPKPFSWNELEARVRAVVRRSQSRNPTGAEQTPSTPMIWTVDAKLHKVYGPNGWIELSPLEFKLARYLIAAHGTIVERSELLRKVWGFQLLPTTRTVDYFVGRLRKHFEKDPDQPKHFLTARGAGYRFEP